MINNDLAKLIAQAFDLSFPSGKFTSAVVEINPSLLTISDYHKLATAVQDANTTSVLFLVNEATPGTDIYELNITLLKPLLDAFSVACAKQIPGLGCFALLYAPAERVSVELSQSDGLDKEDEDVDD